MGPTIFIHCGLHKTGTSAIQLACAENRGVLAVNDVLYPETRSDEAGHHNLAWELAGDQRFDPDALTINRMLQEIAGFAGTVVLSSEDFESVLCRSEIMIPLMERLRSGNRDICFVIYLRDKLAYIESLYVELLRHGYFELFSKFATEVEQRGYIAFREWIFHLDYSNLQSKLVRLAEIGQARVLWRSYDEAAVSGSVVNDFLEVVGLDPTLLGESADRRVNVRLTMAESVSTFISQHLRRPLDDGERATASRVCRMITAPCRPPSVYLRLRRKAMPQKGELRIAYMRRIYSLSMVRTITRLARLHNHAPRLAMLGESTLAAWCMSKWLPRRLPVER